MNVRNLLVLSVFLLSSAGWSNPAKDCDFSKFTYDPRAREWVLAQVTRELEELRSGKRTTLTKSVDLGRAAHQRFPGAKVPGKDIVLFWLRDLPAKQRTARRRIMEQQRKKTVGAQQSAKTAQERKFVVALVKKEIRQRRKDPKASISTLDDLVIAVKQEFGTEYTISAIMHWLQDGLNARELSERRRWTRQSGQQKTEDVRWTDWRAARDHVVSIARQELQSRQADAHISTAEELSAIAVREFPQISPPGRATIQKWLKADLTPNQLARRSRANLANGRHRVKQRTTEKTAPLRAYIQKISLENVQRAQEDAHFRLPSLEALADQGAEQFPELAARDTLTIGQWLREAGIDVEKYRERVSSQRIKTIAEKLSSKNGDFRHVFISLVQREIDQHRRGEIEELRPLKEIAAEAGETVAIPATWRESFGLKWINKDLPPEDIAYRQLNRPRARPKFNPVVVNGVQYDSAEEAAASHLLQRFLGYNPRFRENFQVLVGRRELDFRIGNTIIEYHRIWLGKETSGRGDFDTSDEARAYFKKMDSLPSSEERTALRKKTEAELKRRYAEKRKALLAKSPHFKDLDLRVVSSADELYSVITELHGQPLPISLSEFRVEYRRVLRTILADARGTPAP